MNKTRWNMLILQIVLNVLIVSGYVVWKSSSPVPLNEEHSYIKNNYVDRRPINVDRRLFHIVEPNHVLYLHEIQRPSVV